MLLSLFSRPILSFGKPFLPKELADPRRILITHFGKIADIVRSIPLLVTLRQRFPHAEIAWLIEEQAAPLIIDHWAINRLIVIKKDWYKHFSEIRRVRQRLRSFAPHVALDPQSSFASSLATWFSGATYRIGFDGKQTRHLHNVHVASNKHSQIEQNQHLLRPMGVFGSSIDFDMPECEKDRLAAQHILHRAGLYGNFAMIHVSAETPATRWREEHFGKVAKYLREQWNLPSLITWSNNEENYAEATVHAAGGAALQVPWKTTLIERKSLSQLATLFLGADTAELQIAASVGTKCVGLFGPTSAEEKAPYGSEHRAVQSPHQSGRHRRKHKQMFSSEWMDAISPDWICEKCDEVLATMSTPDVILLPIPLIQKKTA